MAEPHAHSQPIQTYGPAPHNRNIWPHNSRATVFCLRFWPILLFALQVSVYPLLFPSDRSTSKCVDFVSAAAILPGVLPPCRHDSLQRQLPTHFRSQLPGVGLQTGNGRHIVSRVSKPMHHNDILAILHLQNRHALMLPAGIYIYTYIYTYVYIYIWRIYIYMAYIYMVYIYI